RDRERRREKDRDQRGDDGAVEEWGGAEALADRVPVVGGDEAEAEPRDRRPGEVDHLVGDPGDDGDGERRCEAGETSQQRIADAVGEVAPGPQNWVTEGSGLQLAADL